MQNRQITGKPPWTILNLLYWTTSYFNSHQVENPRASAEILLAHGLGLRRIDLYLRHDQPLDKRELAQFKKLIRRRIEREPVAYILGKKEFWSLELEVNPDVLIPRPETECLVETALSILSAGPQDAVKRILESGTGSGAITIALAFERPRDMFFASDRSIKALALAYKNALRHKLAGHIHFFAGDWFQPLNQSRARFDMIVSNPPYIPSHLVGSLEPEICRYEPRMALDGSGDGLGCIKEIISSAYRLLNPNGYLLLEIGHDQSAAIQKMVGICGHYRDLAFFKDYSGYERVVQMQKKWG